MKKFLIYLLITCSIWNYSCSLLDVEPTTSWTGENMPTEEAHLKSLLYAGYERLQSALRINFLSYGEMRADVFYNNAFNASVDKMVNNRLDNSMPQASWRTFYEIIRQANLVIKFTPELLEKKVLPEASANDLMGQAYALRAYTYFYIVRIWGDAPLVLHPFLSNDDLVPMSKEPQERVFEQIHADLAEAVRLLPQSSSSRTTLTRTAAHAIDAHAYAWEHKYQEALDKANIVLNNTTYTLVPLYNESINVSDKDFKAKVQGTEYANIFNVGRSKESLFELAFSLADGDENQYLTSYLSGNFPYVRPNEKYAQTFDDADWRAVIAHEMASNGRYKTTKFTIGFSADVDTRNIVLLRLADIYLLKAEAIANLGDSDEDRKNAMLIVNKIRNRAGGPTFEIPATDYLDRQLYDADGFKNLILEERKFELTYEGHRWFDLVRNGKAVEVVRENVGIEIDPRSLVWPIHIEEIRRGDGIEQNEYYK